MWVLALEILPLLLVDGVLTSEIRSSWQDVASRLKAVIKDTNSLLEFYYSVGGLLSLKVTPSNPLAG
jgi:hypothetical protein